MYKITLEWTEEGRTRSQTISDTDNTQEVGKIFIGRDEKKCDIVLPVGEKTISRLHVVIFYDFEQNCFFLKNLTSDRPQPNRVIVDGKTIISQQTNISLESVIQLGTISLRITQLEIIQSQESYGVECPNCHRHIPFDYLGDFCPYCGFSLQAGRTTFGTPDQN